MHRSRMSVHLKKFALLAAVALVAMSAGETKAATVDVTLDEQPLTWPSFTGALDEQPATTFTSPQVVMTDGGVSILARPTVSAPLPPAVVTGACMLVGNFVLTQMWKKKQI